MTEYWVSSEKYYCKICKCWTAGHPSNIKKHTDGRIHIQKEQELIAAARQREKDKVKDKKDLMSEIDRIEQAAMQSMGAYSGALQDSSVSSTTKPNDSRTSAQSAATRASPEASAPASSARQGGTSGRPPRQEHYLGLGGTQLGMPRETLEEQAGQIERMQEFVERQVEHINSKRQKTGHDNAAAQTKSPWTATKDPNSGQMYYHNATTGESTWTRPADFIEDVEEPLPSGWTESTDPNSGAKYYHNASTGTSSWERPKASKKEKARDAAFDNWSQLTSSTVSDGGAAAASRGRKSKWVVEVSEEDGRAYFFNTETGESQWEKPADFHIDAPQPPGPPAGPPPGANLDETPLEQLMAKRQADKQQKLEIKLGPGSKEGVVGQWEEVDASESAFGNIRAVEEDSDEEEQQVTLDPLLETKYGLEGRRGDLVQEDIEAVEKTMVEKKSMQVTPARGALSFAGRKKAGGIRKKRTDDDDD